jgi:putative membrane protein
MTAPSKSAGSGVEPETSEQLRSRLAAERTLLAWIRTGLAMMGFGFIVARFGVLLRELSNLKGMQPLEQPRLSLWIGTALVVLGVAVNLIAAGQHARLLHLLREDPMTPRGRPTLGITLALVLALLGIAMAVHLVALG